MHYARAILSLALAAAPVIAAPVEDEAVVLGADLFTRDTIVTCNPEKNNSDQKKGFKISVDNAKKQMEKVKFNKGKSGDPHSWGIEDCDKDDREVWEYPVFWVGAKQKEWKIDTKTKDQDKTPIRLVYAKKGDDAVYCGIMTHSEVDKNNQGKEFFQKCS